MVFSNADKSKHGRSAQDSLATILKRCADAGYVVQVIAEYRIGKEGFSNSKQFYAPFLIIFADESKWALFTTTSMRTDRIKGQQWDAVNLKEIDPLITHVYLIYPDGITDEIKDEFLRQNKKYANKEEYSIIDAIVSQNEISDMIEAYAIKNKTFGQIKDIQGNSFESRVADILSFRQNLENGDTTMPQLKGCISTFSRISWNVSDLINTLLHQSRQHRTKKRLVDYLQVVVPKLMSSSQLPPLMIASRITQ